MEFIGNDFPKLGDRVKKFVLHKLEKDKLTTFSSE